MAGKKTTVASAVNNALKDMDRKLDAVLDGVQNVEDLLVKLEGETTYRVRITLQRGLGQVKGDVASATVEVGRMLEKVRLFAETNKE